MGRAGAPFLFVDARRTMGRGRGGAPSSRMRAGGGRAWGGRAGPPSTSVSRTPGSIRASLLRSSRSKAPGPRRLALLAGAGAVAAGGAGGAAGVAAGVAGEGARVPGSTSCLLGWQPPLLGAWLPSPETFTFSEMFRFPSLSLVRLREAFSQAFRSSKNFLRSLWAVPAPTIPAEEGFLQSALSKMAAV